MRLTLVAGAVIALLGTASVQAADMPIAPPPPPPPVFVDPITAVFQAIGSIFEPPPPPPPPPVVRRH